MCCGVCRNKSYSERTAGDAKQYCSTGAALGSKHSQRNNVAKYNKPNADIDIKVDLDHTSRPAHAPRRFSMRTAPFASLGSAMAHAGCGQSRGACISRVANPWIQIYIQLRIWLMPMWLGAFKCRIGRARGAYDPTKKGMALHENGACSSENKRGAIWAMQNKTRAGPKPPRCHLDNAN